ncbi:MAG TPA: prolyl oligopeptidase family serine peptidase, partial [Thermomicrobiales bacterium]|nr:prolyl oligopeptidase family serine peptidase [Thermomicrobiales bacterium]
MIDTQTKPVTIEEIAGRLIPGAPQISPDGRHVAFTVATSGRKEKRHNRAIWVSIDGQPARRFTGGSGNNQSPRWSPDSSQILFHAQREEDDHHRLYLIPVHGGEAQQLGDLKGSMSAPRWSPDGAEVSVLLSDTESEDEKKRKEEKDDAVVFEDQDKVDRLWVVEVASGKAKCLTHGKRHVRDYAWSPDGEHLVLVTSDSPTANEMFRSSSLRLIPSAGGTSRHLADFRNLPSDPVIRTVDGDQVVAFVGNDHREDPSYAVWTVPLNGGAKRKLIENDRAATEFLIADPASPDGLILGQADGAQVRQYRLSIRSGELTPIPMQGLGDRGSIQSAPSVALAAGEMAVVWTAIDVPEEVYRVSSEGRAARLTSFGEALQGRLSGGELVTWESDDGVDIEGVLVYPRGYEEGTRYPLLVQVHGGPAWHWQDRINMSWHDWAQMMAAKGFAVLLPNPRGSIGYGSPFEQLLQDDVGGGESQDLVSGALVMVERGIADRDRLAIGGWSWGGYLTAWTITQTDIFRAAVMGAG